VVVVVLALLIVEVLAEVLAAEDSLEAELEVTGKQQKSTLL
jgi:hypothetical protein